MKNTNSEKWERYKNTDYFISSYGAVKRKLKNGRWKFLNSERIDKHGYPRVSITINGRQKTIYVHRLVAETFIPNPENKPQINHINGDKTNNRITNLEWVTGRENMQHAYTKLYTAKTKAIVRISKDLQEFVLYPSIQEAARQNNGDSKNIRNAAKTFYRGGAMHTSKGYFWHIVENYE